MRMDLVKRFRIASTPLCLAFLFGLFKFISPVVYLHGIGGTPSAIIKYWIGFFVVENDRQI